MKYKALLVDDEQIAVEILKRHLSEFPDKVEVIGSANNGIRAIELIDTLKPDLVFLDIKMPGLTGFDVVSRIKHQPMIVFTTAYDEFALKSFETNTIDYLLKPISKEKIAQVFEKLENFSKKTDFNSIVKLVEKISKSSRLPIEYNNRIIFMDYKDIYFFKSDNKYTSVNLKNKSYLIDKSLISLEEILDDDFIRIHRSCLVNRNHISEVIKLSSRKWVVKLRDKDQTELPVSRDSHELLF